MEVAPVAVEAMEVAVGMGVAVAAAVEDMDHQVVHKVLDLGAQIKEDQTVAPVALGVQAKEGVTLDQLALGARATLDQVDHGAQVILDQVDHGARATLDQEDQVKTVSAVVDHGVAAKVAPATDGRGVLIQIPSFWVSCQRSLEVVKAVGVEAGEAKEDDLMEGLEISGNPKAEALEVIAVMEAAQEAIVKEEALEVNNASLCQLRSVSLFQSKSVGLYQDRFPDRIALADHNQFADQ